MKNLNDLLAFTINTNTHEDNKRISDLGKVFIVKSTKSKHKCHHCYFSKISGGICYCIKDEDEWCAIGSKFLIYKEITDEL